MHFIFISTIACIFTLGKSPFGKPYLNITVFIFSTTKPVYIMYSKINSSASGFLEFYRF